MHVDDGGVGDIEFAREPQVKLQPDRVSIWPIDEDRFGVDFTYHGATGYADAEFAEGVVKSAGLAATFRQELDQAWTVRIGPIPRAAVLDALQRFVL
jgi:hypothetical protein